MLLQQLLPFLLMPQQGPVSSILLLLSYAFNLQKLNANVISL